MNKDVAGSRIVAWVVVAIATLAATNTPQVAKAQAMPSSLAISQEASSLIEQILDAYEGVRARLAEDEISAVTAAATTLEDAASRTVPLAPEQLRGALREIRGAAEHLRQMPKENESAVRGAFGELSR